MNFGRELKEFAGMVVVFRLFVGIFARVRHRDDTFDGLLADGIGGILGQVLTGKFREKSTGR